MLELYFHGRVGGGGGGCWWVVKTIIMLISAPNGFELGLGAEFGNNGMF